jgi:hypothetical protein
MGDLDILAAIAMQVALLFWALEVADITVLPQPLRQPLVTVEVEERLVE